MTQTLPKVSIGMPVYNGEKFIREALDSLIVQTFTDFEIIISDNASTDGTEAICLEYAARDSRIRYERKSENRGAPANFLFVLDEAVGEYFMWAAYDDLWGKDYLSTAVSLLDSDTSIGFGFPSFKLVSIRTGLSVSVDKDIFSFIEDCDKNRRVIGFANLHHMSHKCNLVYSLFRIGILKKAFAVQDISNDGLMSMVFLGMARGKIVSGFYFSKRYKNLWPGFMNRVLAPFRRLAPKTNNREFDVAVDNAFSKAIRIFPELGRYFNVIKLAYLPDNYCSKFEIVNNLLLCVESSGTKIAVEGKLYPKVSIGMPVYNGEPFIREALDSLLAQTFTDFELVISDNASTDDTEVICREYAAKDKRIRYVRQPENRGALPNFRFVLDEAVGEYFMWAAADDVWSLNWIETLLPIAEAYSCLAYGTLQTIDANGNNIVHPANQKNFDYSGQRVIRRIKYYLEPGFCGKPNPIYGIYPRKILTSKLFNVLYSHNSDMLLLYELLKEHEIRSTTQTYLYKRIHNNCAGGGMLTCESVNHGLIARIKNVIFLILIAPNLKNYLLLSNKYESIFVLLGYPVAVCLTLFKTLQFRYAKRKI